VSSSRLLVQTISPFEESMNECRLYRNRIRVGRLILFLMLASTFAFGDSSNVVLTSNGAGGFDYAVSSSSPV